tara:strand:+ start:1022 stop:1741 length:720 start_codon:yes stop_codon:yes gene_type:complete
MPKNEDKRLRLRPSVFLALAILIGGSAASGCVGDDPVEDDPLLGIWYQDDDRNGLQFTSSEFAVLEEGLPTENSDYGVSSWFGLSKDIVDGWSTSGDMLTLTSSAMAPHGDEEFACDDGNAIPLSYVNDGWDDCDNGEDEGVDIDTLDVEWNIPMSIEFVWKFEIVGDVMFAGILSMEMTSEGSTQSYSVPEDKICDTDDGECYAYIRSTAMAGAQHATVLNGVESPEWWVDNTSDWDD